MPKSTLPGNGPVDTSTLLSIADLLRPVDVERLEIPELPKGPDGKPGVVYYKPLVAGDVIDVAESSDGKADKDSMLKLLTRSLCNPDGTPLFSLEDIKQLRDMRASVFNRITAAVNGSMAPDGTKTGKADSPSSETASTGTASPTV